MKRFGQAAALVTVALASLTAPAFAQSPRGAARVDFDDQLIQGQVNRGAVHLIERKDSDLGSLVKVRKSYRTEILAGSEVENVVLSTVTGEARSSNVAGGNVAPVRMAAAQVLAPTEAAVVAAPAVAQPRISLISLPQAADVKAPAKKSKPAPKTTTKLGGSRVISRR